MLRVAEQAERTDTGRQRRANEDAYFARPPVFVVADGMGGAQAGEVASRMAAEAFEAGSERDEPPEAYLRRVATEANRRIHEVAQKDSSRSGMGTTLTAAMLRGDEVSLAHVGDSRAYLLRDGELRRLTSDHSLVEELRRQGRLTEQQAEEHPQRSIITRALGPEPEVEVDTMTYRARPGDVVLLCSDGLTTMVPEDVISELISKKRDLRGAVRQLVREANERGGRDNITVLAFRLEDAATPAPPAEEATLIGPTAAQAGLEEPVGAPVAGAPGRARGSARRPPARRRGRRILVALGALLVVAGIGAAAVYGARQVYFLGTDEGGRIALYRGLPYDLPLGIQLYDERYSSPVQADSVPPDRVASVTDHELRSRADAVSLIDDLERAALESERAAAAAAADGGSGGGGGAGGSAGSGGANSGGGAADGGGDGGSDGGSKHGGDRAGGGSQGAGGDSNR